MKRHRSFGTTLSIGLVLALVPAATASAEEVVNDNTDDPGACATPDHATVQAGVNAATNDETVLVCPGTYAETVALPGARDGLTLDGTDVRPVITGGLQIGIGMTDLTLRDLHVQNLGGAVNSFVIGRVASGANVTNLTMDNVMVDGNDVAGQHGVGSAQLNGVIDVHDSQFVDIPNWVTLDTRSGSGGATQGADLSSFNFSDNFLSGNGGHVNARGTIGDSTPTVTIANNVVEDYPDALTDSAAVFKAFYAVDLDFTNNDISNIGTLQSTIGTDGPYGAGLMPRNIVDLSVNGNSFDDSVQGVAFEPRNTINGGFPDGVIGGGTISGNTFSGNTQGIFVTATNHPNSNLVALSIVRNRFVGNTQAIDNNSAMTATAENNWWGCNAGPGNTGCDANGGGVDSDPRLVLGVSANPATVNTGGTSQITATMSKNSNGADVAGVGSLGGISVGFATDLGGVSPASAALANGTGQATFTAGATPGTANVTATVDNQTAATQVAVTQPPADPPPEPPPSDGGTEGDDAIGGTTGDDVLDGLGGDDSLFGGMGDDAVFGGSGADELHGGPGGDEVRGGEGDDDIGSGAGNDEVSGGPGDDVIDGGGGKDDIGGGSGEDTIDSQDGNADTIRCGPDEDELNADGKDRFGPNCETVR